MVRNKKIINSLHTNLLSWNFEDYYTKNLVSKEIVITKKKKKTSIQTLFP